MSETLPEAFFLPSHGGALFCLYHPPQGAELRGKVLHLHPFAEELNTCRKISAQFARRLASQGYAVMQFDMHGCGDSDGQFSEATWSHWRQDALTALAELERRTACHSTTSSTPLWLWGVRSGTLMAADLLGHMTQPCHMLWWQAMQSGAQMLQQWLRLDAAKQWLQTEAPTKPTSAAAQLKQGITVHVAGYPISPALAASMTELKPQAKHTSNPQTSQLLCLEACTHRITDISPALERQLTTWQYANWQTQALSVQAPAFWQQFGDSDLSVWLDASWRLMEGH